MPAPKRPKLSPEKQTAAKAFPECPKVFQGAGWTGVDAHWKAEHDNVMPYAKAWPLLKAGTYKAR